MTRYGTVVGFSGALADEHLVGDEALGARTGARPWNAECATGAQASGELTSQSTPALDEQCLVDRLVSSCIVLSLFRGMPTRCR
jgi:hypothetical protein